MKKDNKRIVLKSLIIAVFLILGNTALAQHPLLGPNELHVYAFPHQLQVTIGKQANDEGRTCYKWNGYFSENGTEERIGSKQVFDLPSYMSSAGSSYEFELTVIGEQYYRQTVELHIVEEITFQVQPKKGCFSGNERPQIEDFEITTNPRGYENLVHLVDFYSSQFSSQVGTFDVKFQLKVNNMIMDEKIVTVLYTDYSFTEKYVPVDLYYQCAWDLISIPEKICEALSGSLAPYFIDVLPPGHVGNWTFSIGYDCCNDRIERQGKLDVDRLSVLCGININDGHYMNPAFFLFNTYISGSMIMEFGIENIHFSKMYKTCDSNPPDPDAYLFHNYNNSLEVHVEDIALGLIFNANAGFRYHFKDSTLKLSFGNPGFIEASGCFHASLVLYADYTQLSFFKCHYEKELLPDCGNCFNKRVNLNIE